MKVGFSIKLDMDFEAINIIDEYFMHYDICEIKLDFEDLNSPYFDIFLAHIIKNHQQKVSFHLLSSLLDKWDLNIQYFELMKSKLTDFTGYLIVHIPNSNNVNKKLDICKKNVPDFSHILFENDKNISIVDFANFVNQYSVHSCLDLGHAYLNNKKMLNDFQFKCREDILRSIKEIHLHNVIGKKDHQLFLKRIPMEMIVPVESILNGNRIILEIKKINVFENIAKEQYNLVKNFFE